ncbi:MAG: histidine kinase dimerization/phospho-acceptor domain-containing protein, partial [Bacillota bacterium]|nr:histidine kinase dimerization/phospho-acceptor domain-containing protein [Bacillota bacterium]
MKEDFRITHTKLVTQETKTTKLFLILFYLLFLSFDAFYYFLYPLLKGKKQGIPNEGLGIWLYVIVIGLLPIGMYFLKNQKPFIVKYIYLFGYLGTDIIHDLMIYLNSEKPFQAGNIVEILFVLFTPIFVNRKYFWIASSTLIGKYILLGILLRDSHVLLPILIFLVFTAIAFVILNRFFSYIRSLTSIHEEFRQNEKLAVIGQMATAIGHEIRNPLASLRGFSQLQLERNPTTSEFYPIMIQEIDRINIIVNDLMYVGKPKALKFKKENIEEIIAYTLSISKHQAEQQGVIVETIMEGPLPPIECDGHQLKQVFINLFKNAIESMPDGGP